MQSRQRWQPVNATSFTLYFHPTRKVLLGATDVTRASVGYVFPVHNNNISRIRLVKRYVKTYSEIFIVTMITITAIVVINNYPCNDVRFNDILCLIPQLCRMY